MTYLNNDKRKQLGKKKKITLVLLVLLFLIAVNFLPQLFPQKIARTIMTPLVRLQAVSQDGVAAIVTAVTPKSTLQERVDALTTQVTTLENRLLQEQFVQADLRAIRDERQWQEMGVTARVLSRPPFSPYDTLTIENIGADIMEGDLVYAQGALLGSVVAVTGDTALVNLLSTAETITTVRIGGVDVEAFGRGAGGFIATLQKDVVVEIGDPIQVPQYGVALLGVITKIIERDEAAFRDVFFTTPVSLSQLDFVTVISNKQ